jgi:hypothetical protein
MDHNQIIPLCIIIYQQNINILDIELNPMLSFSPLSTTPYATLGGISPLYVGALFSCEANLDLSPVLKFYESAQFDCFANFEVSLYAKRQIDVYHIMYTKTDIDYTMTVDTSEVQILHYLATFDTVSYITTDLSLELELTKDIDFIMEARNETLFSIDFIMNVVKETL